MNNKSPVSNDAHVANAGQKDAVFFISGLISMPLRARFQPSLSSGYDLRQPG